MDTEDVENPILAEDSQLKNGSTPEYGSFGQDSERQESARYSKDVMEFGIEDMMLAYSQNQYDISHVNFYKVRSVRY